MRAYASHSGKYDSRAMNIGYVVDRDKHSPTYKRYVALPKHAEAVLDKIFKRLIDFGGDAFALMHELEEQEGVHFSWHDDPLFNNKMELIKIPGVGYRIGTYSTLLHILRNKVYKGTWVTGNKEYPKNHEAIVDDKTWDLVQYLLDKRQEGSHVHPRNHSETFNGEEYWSLAYTKRDNRQDTIFFVDRHSGTNQEVIRSIFTQVPEYQYE